MFLMGGKHTIKLELLNERVIVITCIFLIQFYQVLINGIYMLLFYFYFFCSSIKSKSP